MTPYPKLRRETKHDARQRQLPAGGVLQLEAKKQWLLKIAVAVRSLWAT
ncbi:MAG: hypothetical protein K8R23_06750 [Chthoniobacter sp.]|nr:hypothetical protein [Chthoniobacter sp.]